mmetsp:Transcript_39915/g.78474  ORF Transcript_39915/g.78474 Transcript_39915/m.78474 type:complete len:97 (+) Transcript_39915:62-352(+)
MTGVDGVMSARGILANPAMFNGDSTIPVACLRDYLQLALEYGGPFTIHHHHLMFMMHGHISRAERHEFSLIRSMAGLIDFFRERDWWHPKAGSAFV